MVSVAQSHGYLIFPSTRIGTTSVWGDHSGYQWFSTHLTDVIMGTVWLGITWQDTVITEMDLEVLAELAEGAACYLLLS